MILLVICYGCSHSIKKGAGILLDCSALGLKEEKLFFFWMFCLFCLLAFIVIYFTKKGGWKSGVRKQKVPKASNSFVLRTLQ